MSRSVNATFAALVVISGVLGATAGGLLTSGRSVPGWLLPGFAVCVLSQVFFVVIQELRSFTPAPRSEDGGTEIAVRSRRTIPSGPVTPKVRPSWGWRVSTVVMFLALVGVGTWSVLRTESDGPSDLHSRTTALEAIRELGQQKVGGRQFQLAVNLSKHVDVLPTSVNVNSIELLLVADIEAYVDCAALEAGAITISPDGRAVEILMPSPILGKPRVDWEKSVLRDRDAGIINRVQDIYDGNEDAIAAINRLAESEAIQAADDSDMRQRGEDEMRRTIEFRLRQVGYERVTIVFHD